MKNATVSSAVRRVATSIVGGQDQTVMKILMSVRMRHSTVVQTRTAQTLTDHSFVNVTLGISDCQAERSDVSVSVEQCTLKQ